MSIEGGSTMGLVIIFLFVTLFAAAGFVRELKNRNIMGSGFAFLTVAVFGWFSVMTIYDSFFSS
jgi:hypothetical protein